MVMMMMKEKGRDNFLSGKERREKRITEIKLLEKTTLKCHHHFSLSRTFTFTHTSAFLFFSLTKKALQQHTTNTQLKLHH
jgi:hypothetical protein